MAGKMHSDEFQVDEALVRRLLSEQFPEWSELPLQRIGLSGSDNAHFLLGDDMVVRLPIHPTHGRIEKEYEWMPKLAPHLTIPVPVPLVRGKPADSYPWDWLVCTRLRGAEATIDRLLSSEVARQLAGFVSELQRIDPSGGPEPGEHNFGRGTSLASRDVATRTAISALGNLIDGEAALSAWDRSLHASEWSREPVWVHGDLTLANLLVLDGRICGVLDFGGLGVGDPACDLIAAWNVLTEEGRAIFRAGVDVDEETWQRGKGWALSVAVIALPYYAETNEVIADGARRMISAVLAEA